MLFLEDVTSLELLSISHTLLFAQQGCHASVTLTWVCIGSHFCSISAPFLLQMCAPFLVAAPGKIR